MRTERPYPNYLRLLTTEELRELETHPGMHDCVRAEFSRRNSAHKASVPRSTEVHAKCLNCGTVLRLPLSEGIRPSARDCYTCKECCGYYQAKPKRRKGRGKFESVDNWSRRYATRSAEVDPQATRSTDQTITELSLKSKDSDGNAAILHGHEKAADRLAHIQSSLSATHRKVILRVLDVVEPGDPIREIARKAGLHAPQVSRAFDAARQADRRQIFRRASREGRPPAIAYTPYNPNGVPMATVMMPAGSPAFSRLLRGETVGGWELKSERAEEAKRDPVRKALVQWKNCPCLREKLGATECEKCKKRKAIWKQAMMNGYGRSNQKPVPERMPRNKTRRNGCHPNRQWLRVGFGGLRLTCPDCKAELARAGILTKP